MIYVTFPTTGSGQQYTWETYMQLPSGNFIGSPAKGIVNANIAAQNVLMASPFLIAKTTSISSLSINVGLIGSLSSILMAGIYTNLSNDDCYPDQWLNNSYCSFDLNTLGQQTLALNTVVTITPGLYWFVSVHNSVTLPQLHCIASPGTSANTMPGVLGWTSVDSPFNGWNVTTLGPSLPGVFDAGGSNVSVYLPNIIATTV